jgi:CRP-like cAMP-binding protein
MALISLSRSRPVLTVDDLVAKGRHSEAAEALRAELRTRTSTLADRLRLADLLVLAERGPEALPILLWVADEQARFGFVEKALEALRRADAIAPGRTEVRDRFVALSRAARASRTQRTQPVPALTPGPERGQDKTDPYLPSARAKAAAAKRPEPRRAKALAYDRELFAFVRALGDRPAAQGRPALARTLFAELQQYVFRRIERGLQRRLEPEGAIVVTEGHPGDSVFLIASGSVRILVLGGHGRALEIRRLDAGDFFGEVAALSGRPRSATVVAVTDCELLEIERWALDCLVDSRPDARPILENAFAGRERSPEESVVRSLPEAASPERAAEVLKTHFGGCVWSPRVRLQLARLMLDAGQGDDALAILASVAEELAGRGRARQAISILKKVEALRRRGERAVAAAPSRKADRRALRAKDVPEAAPSRAASEAEFREWVVSLLKKTARLAGAQAAPSEEEEATRAQAPGPGRP